MYSFEDILKQVDAQYYHRYMNFVHSIKDILSFQQAPFDTYAGEKHIRSVIQNLDLLIPDNIKQKLSSTEIFLLLIAAWLHDIGKIREFDSSKSYSEQITKHAEIGFDYIINKSAIFQLDEKEALIIAYIVKGHGILDLSDLPSKKGLGASGAIDVRKLAAILRFADELDIEYLRVPTIVKEISGIEGVKKWDIRNNIDGVEIRADIWDIVVYCTPKNYDILEDIKNTVDWINNRLTEIRDELRKLDIYYKSVELEVDDVYLKTIQTAEKKKTESSKSNQKISVNGISELCPFNGKDCIFKISVNKRMVFIGMPFSSRFIDLYQFGLKSALEDLNLIAWRADEVVSTGPIFCKICRAIKQCGLAIIDISDTNPNVMFELGMASASGKRIILIKAHKHKVPSDLAGFEYFEYDTIIGLRERLLSGIPVIIDEMG